MPKCPHVKKARGRASDWRCDWCGLEVDTLYFAGDENICEKCRRRKQIEIWQEKQCPIEGATTLLVNRGPQK